MVIPQPPGYARNFAAYNKLCVSDDGLGKNYSTRYPSTTALEAERNASNLQL